MSETIGQIENNDIKHLKLNDTDDYMIDNVYKFIDALSKNTSIESIDFQGEYLGCLRSDGRSELLKMVAKLPNLHEVRMNHSLVLISDIAEIISKGESLQVIVLNHLVLQGIDMEFTACETALSCSASLKEFEMKDCIPAVGDISLEQLHLAGKR